MPENTSVDAPWPIEHALIEAARSLTSRLDVGGVAIALLDGVQPVVGATSSWVLLHEPVEHRLRAVGFRGPGADAFREVVMPEDAGIMGLAFT